MAICLVAAGKAAVVAASAFTLSWTHSVEKTRWEEDWRLTPAGLELVAARVKGSGAGMDIPDGAVLRDGAWTYRPALAPQSALLLARSGATGEGWELCSEMGCREIGASPDAPVEIRACEVWKMRLAPTEGQNGSSQGVPNKQESNANAPTLDEKVQHSR